MTTADSRTPRQQPSQVPRRIRSSTFFTVPVHSCNSRDAQRARFAHPTRWRRLKQRFCHEEHTICALSSLNRTNGQAGHRARGASCSSDGWLGHDVSLFLTGTWEHALLALVVREAHALARSQGGYLGRTASPWSVLVAEAPHRKHQRRKPHGRPCSKTNSGRGLSAASISVAAIPSPPCGEDTIPSRVSWCSPAKRYQRGLALSEHLSHLPRRVKWY
jgi:hypothetical protein